MGKDSECALDLDFSMCAVCSRRHLADELGEVGLGLDRKGA